MARTTEPDNEFDPRHRIVGAIILVTLAVIVLPLILDEQASPLRVQASTDSAPGAADGNELKPAKVVIKRLSDEKPAAPVIAKDKSPATEKHARIEDKPKTRVVVKELGAEKPVTVAKPEPRQPIAKEKPKPAPTVSSTPAVTKPHWAVQVGTFSNPGNVRRLSKQLKEYGYSLMLKDVNLKQGAAVRVRVGPYTTRASADKAQGKIRQQIGVKGVVVAGP